MKTKIKRNKEKSDREVTSADYALPSDETPESRVEKKRGRPAGSKSKASYVLGEYLAEGLDVVVGLVTQDQEKLSLGERKIVRRMGDAVEEGSEMQIAENLGKYGLWVLVGVSTLIVAGHWLTARRKQNGAPPVELSDVN